MPHLRRPLLAMLMAAAAGPARANAASGIAAEPVDTDLIVTAQRRPEALSQTPIAITALTGQFIERARLHDVKDIVTFTPGFSGNSDDSYIDSLAIRGIVSNDYGIGGDPSIGIFKDGVYQGRSGAAVTSLYDVERAEALRGPQGFLFGRNAISGAISIVTNKPKPDETSADLRLSVGQARQVEVEAVLNLPIGDGLAFRAASFHTSRDGWVDNIFAPGKRLMGNDDNAARLSLLYDRGPVRLLLSAEHERRRASGTPYRASNVDREVIDAIDSALGTDLVIRGGPRDVDSDLTDPRDDGSITSLSVQADVDLDFATLTSITAWRGYRFFYSEDYDGTALFLGNDSQRQHGHYASQEVRLVSQGGGRLNWSMGAAGYSERVAARFSNFADENLVCRVGFGYDDCNALTADLYGRPYVPAPDGVLVDTNDARSVNSGLSLYGDGNFRALRRLVIGAALRYSWDHKKFGIDVLPSQSSLGNIWTFSYFTDGFLKAAKSWAGFTPRIYARFEASRDLNIYASLTRGYKAGGFGSFTVAAPGPVGFDALVPAGTRPDAFAPETVWSKEIGIKGAILDRRIRFDVTAFHYVYSNLQSNYFNTETRTQQVINVGKVHGYGIETGLTIKPSAWFDLYGNLTWTRTRKSGDRDCQSADCGGLPNPIWASSGVATFHYPARRGEAYLQTQWTYEGHRRESFDWRGITRRSAYATANLRLGYMVHDAWEAAIHVENLFDTLYYRGAENGGYVTPANVWGVAQPRTIGIDLSWHFRR